MPRLVSSNPKYQKHRASGQAIVTLDGQDFYLGPFGSKASKVAYDRLIGEWLANGRRLPQADRDVTVGEVLEAYLRFAEGYYTAPACGYASEWDTTKQALRYPARLYSATLAAEFGPLALKTCREAMIKEGLCRTHINQQVGRIKRMFKWAVEQELIGAEVWHALQAVAGLRAGKTVARESDPIKPVAEEHVKLTLAHLSPTVKAMVELQLISGMRPGEVCRMRSCDIDTSGLVWVYKPSHHKTEHHGHERLVYLGPKAQAVLKPLLKPDLQAYIFSPTEAERERRKRVHAERLKEGTPLSCGNVPGSNRQRRPRRKPGIAALKRQVAQLSKTVAFLEAQEKKRVGQQPVPQEIGDVRFRADGLRSHRAKLGLSAKDYGKLVGVAGLTIYQWEGGKAKPRKQQLAKLAAVRGIGKREAIKRLELLGVSTAGKRGEYSQTAEEFVASLVKSRKATTSAAINAEWKESGRPGKADNTLSKMVRDGKLKRTKLKGERGSRYSVA